MQTHLIQTVCFSESKAPAGLERPPDHSAARGGCGTGQSERVLKFDAAQLDTDIYLIHRRVELGQPRLVGDADSVLRLENRFSELGRDFIKFLNLRKFEL